MKYKYHPYQQDVVLLKGIADIHPYKLHLPDCPEPEKITNYGLHPKDQVFQREVIPRELTKIDRLVKTGQITRDEGVAMIDADPALSSFVEGLWRKRTGVDLVFQYINGHPIHIPPMYWMYLNFWQMPKVPHERPMFRMDFHHYCTDLWFFCFWQYLVKTDPFCMGCILFGQRQFGKSYIGAFLGWETVSYDYEAHAGSQSKTDKDIAKVYNKCLVRPWTNLLFFWKPKFSNSSYPKAEGMQFTPPADRSKEKSNTVLVEVGEEYLMGSFDYRASSVDAYDGDTLDYYWMDETGKSVEVNVVDRWATVKEALKRRGGKAFGGTTVEELDKRGGKNFKILWDGSDRSPIKRGQKPITVDANGETDTGLWPWYTPSYCNECFDAHGIAIVDSITERQIECLRSMALILNIKYPTMCGIDAVDHQINRAKTQKAKQDIIRKKPRNIKEAFASASRFCHFNREKLSAHRAKHLHGYTAEELPESQWPISEIQNEVANLTGHQKSQYNFSPGVRWGKFEWIDPTQPYKCGVYFQPTAYEDAKFHVNYLLEPGMRNRYGIKNGKWDPCNCAKIRSGADPFKYNTPDVKNKDKMSDGAQHVYMFYDAHVDGKRPQDRWITKNFVYEYLWRTEIMGKAELFEDYAKACIYYGCKLYPERNIDEVLDHFKRNGMENYIHLGIKPAIKDGAVWWKQETVGGDITNKLVIENMIRHLADWVNNDLDSCVFWRTAQELEELEDDFNPYDLAASSSYTLMASYEVNLSNNVSTKPSVVSKDDIMELTDGYWPN